MVYGFEPSPSGRKSRFSEAYSGSKRAWGSTGVIIIATQHIIGMLMIRLGSYAIVTTQIAN
jgi:hypothetical protein